MRMKPTIGLFANSIDVRYACMHVFHNHLMKLDNYIGDVCGFKNFLMT